MKTSLKRQSVQKLNYKNRFVTLHHDVTIWATCYLRSFGMLTTSGCHAICQKVSNIVNIATSVLYFQNKRWIYCLFISSKNNNRKIKQLDISYESMLIKVLIHMLQYWFHDDHSDLVTTMLAPNCFPLTCWGGRNRPLRSRFRLESILKQPA